MVFKICWNHHFMPKACNLRFGLKNEMAKMDKVAFTCDFANYTTNESETSFNGSHMVFGGCMSCQTGGNELAC
jgi:hypothetical protein